MNFAKPNIRISLSLSPGECLKIDDRLLHQKTLKILSVVNPRTYAHHLCNSLPPIYPYGYLYAHIILMIIPRRSCCYNMSRNILHCFENPLSLMSCSFISRENPYGYFLTFIEDPFSLIVHMSPKILRNTFRCFENPLQAVTLEILACLHYGSFHMTSSLRQYRLT